VADRAASERGRALVAFAAFGAWWGAWGASVPDVQREAGVSDGQLGTAVLFVGLGALASMRLAGAAVDRLPRAALTLAIAGFAVAGVLPALAGSMASLAAALAVLGAASGALDVAINTAAVDAEVRSGRPLLNLAHACFSLGVILSSAATGALRAGGATPVQTLGGTGTVLLLLAGWIATRSVGPRPEPVRDAGLTVEPKPWWRLDRRLVVLGLLVALAFLVENAWQTWSALHLERSVGASPFVGSLGPAMFAASAAAGRLGGHRLEARLDRLLLVRAGAALAAVGALVAALGPIEWLALGAIAAVGLGTATAAPALLALAGAGAGHGRRGSSIGTVTTLGYLGFVLSPALVGLLAGATTLPTALAATAAVAAALSAGVGRVRPPSPAPSPPSGKL
jgi:MFS family permease